MLRKDGSTCWILARGSAIRSPDGKACRLTGTDTDITERKLTEEKLQNSEAELLALFNAMTDIVLVLDARGRYLKIAPTAPELLYKPAPEVLGKTLAEIFPEAEANFALATFAKHWHLGKPTELNTGWKLAASYCGLMPVFRPWISIG
jgi:PAS domain-containing protein